VNSNPEEASAEMDNNFEVSSAHLCDVSWSGNTVTGFMIKIRSDPELATFESLLYIRNNHPKFQFLAYKTSCDNDRIIATKELKFGGQSGVYWSNKIRENGGKDDVVIEIFREVNEIVSDRKIISMSYRTTWQIICTSREESESFEARHYSFTLYSLRCI